MPLRYWLPIYCTVIFTVYVTTIVLANNILYGFVYCTVLIINHYCIVLTTTLFISLLLVCVPSAFPSMCSPVFPRLFRQSFESRILQGFARFRWCLRYCFRGCVRWCFRITKKPPLLTALWLLIILRIC